VVGQRSGRRDEGFEYEVCGGRIVFFNVVVDALKAAPSARRQSTSIACPSFGLYVRAHLRDDLIVRNVFAFLIERELDFFSEPLVVGFGFFLRVVAAHCRFGPNTSHGAPR
jgi:hypothetical protein